MKSLLRSGFGLALLLSSAASQAEDVCSFCNVSVSFDEALATCFESEVPKQLAQTTLDFVMINLGGCGDETRTRSGLPLQLPVDSQQSKLDSSFVATRTALECLTRKVAERQKPLAAPQTFDLARACE